MSSPKPAKIGVRISKETGGAYADLKEVIQSELERIRKEWLDKATAAQNSIQTTNDGSANTNDNRANQS